MRRRCLRRPLPRSELGRVVFLNAEPLTELGKLDRHAPKRGVPLRESNPTPHGAAPAEQEYRETISDTPPAVKGRCGF
jgi:hypothetical protein